MLIMAVPFICAENLFSWRCLFCFLGFFGGGGGERKALGFEGKKFWFFPQLFHKGNVATCDGTLQGRRSNRKPVPSVSKTGSQPTAPTPEAHAKKPHVEGSPLAKRHF